jgi:type VI secretion system protein ImpG
MDPRLLDYYSQELQYIRETGAEFAQEFPKIAARLAISGIDCSDPYVERLIEGFAFLAARVQLRIDSEFPRFTQNLLQMVYPDYLCPMPSAAVVQMSPNYDDAALAKGVELPSGSALIAQRSAEAVTPCEYRTSQGVTLLPLQVVEATYRSYAGDFPPGLALARAPQAVLRIKLRTTAGLKFNHLSAKSLPVFLCGTENIANRLYEMLLGAAEGIFLAVPGQKRVLGRLQPRECIRGLGFSDAEAMLPAGPRTFQGHRLLQEYFLFPGRFLFVELGGLAEGFRAADSNEVEIVVPLSRHEPVLEGSVSADDFALFCTPAINLFPKRVDRIHITDQVHEYHVVPDRTRPMDFEVYRVSAVTGFGENIEAQQEFLPFYAVYDERAELEGEAYFTARRTPRLLSEKQRRIGPRTNYVGSDVYLSLVDSKEAPFSGDLRQLGVQTLCTNRDLPLRMPIGSQRGDFTLEASAPVEAVRCRKGPTAPVAAHAPGESTWRLIGLLSQNYLSLLDSNSQQGAEALRELLALCAVHSEPHVRKQIAALRSVASRQIVRRLPTSGPVAFGRGVEAVLEIDEAGLGGAGAFMMAAVLRHYLARHASINGFVETALKVTGRGEVMRWPAMIGTRPAI